MLGAAGALCCLAAGTAVGSWMRMRRMTRLNMLQSVLDVLNAMRLMLETERMALPELLEKCADYAGTGDGAELVGKRFLYAARQLRQEPLEGMTSAYALACRQIPTVWEQEEEKAALESLFAQLGNGTAAMRGQAVAACIRRLKPVQEKAREEAQKGGRLCIQLGMLLGLMAGIALW